MTEARAKQTAIELAGREVLYETGSLEAAEVTVCITLYNYEAFILETLESVHSQTLGALAVVVLDDCSTDGGPARVESWMRTSGSRFAGAALVRHERNAGLAWARNGAIDTARSPFAMVLDADNQLYPRCTERMAGALSAAPGFGFAYSVIERFGDHQGLMGTSSWNVELLEAGNYVDAMALLRKSTWERVGGYERMRVGGWEDYDFWCKCVENDIAGLFVPEILCRYRVHRESMLMTETERGANSRRVRREMHERHPWLRIEN